MSDWNRITPLIYVEAVIHIVELSATISPLLGETTTDDFYIFAEKFASDALLSFVKTNFNMVSPRKRRSLSRTPRGRPFVSPHHFPQNQE
jgi:hypothetical protein